MPQRSNLQQMCASLLLPGEESRPELPAAEAANAEMPGDDTCLSCSSSTSCGGPEARCLLPESAGGEPAAGDAVHSSACCGTVGMVCPVHVPASCASLGMHCHRAFASALTAAQGMCCVAEPLTPSQEVRLLCETPPDAAAMRQSLSTCLWCGDRGLRLVLRCRAADAEPGGAPAVRDAARRCSRGAEQGQPAGQGPRGRPQSAR